MNNKNIYNILRLWIPLAVVSAFSIGFVYFAVQQNYRLSADDQQIQISEDASNYFKNGGQISDPPNKLEISQSLNVYYLAFDSKKKLLATSAVLHEKPAVVPDGVFDYAKNKGQNRFTWQPEKGIRVAAVLTYFKGKNEGYVLAGKSLKEVDKRTDALKTIALISWAGSLVLSLIIILFFELYIIKKIKK